MKRPYNKAEVDKIDVTPDEEREFAEGVRRVGKALTKARIPSTLEWATVLLSTAARTLHVTGMPREMFRDMVEASYEHSVQTVPKKHQPLPPVPTLAQLGPMRRRLVNALLDAKIDLQIADTPCWMVALAGDVCAEYGATVPEYLGFADALFTEAEEAPGVDGAPARGTGVTPTFFYWLKQALLLGGTVCSFAAFWWAGLALRIAAGLCFVFALIVQQIEQAQRHQAELERLYALLRDAEKRATEAEVALSWLRRAREVHG